MSVKEILLQISIWSILVPLFSGILILKKLNRDSQIVLGIVVLASIPQILTAFIMNSQALIILYNLYTPIEFFLFYIIFRNRLIASDRQLINYSVFIYLIGSGLILAVLPFSRFLNEWACLNNVIYIYWSLLFIRTQYNEREIEIKKTNPFAWFLVGLSLYATCTILVFAFYNYLGDHQSILWIIHSFFNTLMYLLFAAGFISNLYRVRS